MRNRRFLGGLAAGLVLLGGVLGGCGVQGSGAPSSLDPATIAPANSVIYAELTVRPQGSQRSQEEQALHKLFGARADASIRRAVAKLLRQSGANYGRDVQPWLGQRVGVVITQLVPGASNGLDRSAFAVIAPTSDPSAARAFIQRALKRDGAGESGGIVAGHYAVVGGGAAYQAVSAVAKGQGLAASPGYQATVAQLPSDPAATYYMNLPRLVSYFGARLRASGAFGGLLRQALGRLGPNAALAGSVTLSPRALSFDSVETGVRRAASSVAGLHANVGRLPAGAWLAIDTGASTLSPASLRRFEAGFQLGLEGGLASQGLAGRLPGAMAARLGFIEKDVLPALGPFSLAVGGTSPLNLSAGFDLKPADPAAAGRLLGMLRSLAARDPSLGTTGTATAFSIHLPTGGSLVVNEKGGRVVATYGFLNQQAFLSPSSTLSGTPAFQRAVAQLPSGSSVPLYVSFGPIASLVQLAAHGASAQRTSRVLNKLDYLIAGGRAGHIRVVVGLK